MSEAREVLSELAFDLRWAWNHQADALWEAIDAELWRATANAWVVVVTTSTRRLEALWESPAFRDLAVSLRDKRRESLGAPAWYQLERGARPATIAFFSMEFALSEALPLYSGGLGNVAGDYLKAASDLGVPLVGVGLLYQQGYFRQRIDRAGAQQEVTPFNDTSQMPVVPVRDAEGEWVRVRIPAPGAPIFLRAWEARVGRIALYLLDSNDPANTPWDRGITAQLYGGGAEVRLLQEVALGIGGMRLLAAIGREPDVCHLNEGHAALAVLERARRFAEAAAVPFDVALAATRAGNVLTTHTPVDAGFDRFSPELFAAHLGVYADRELRVPMTDLLALGRAHPIDPSEPICMTWLALRGSAAVNGVSARHAAVSRRIFQILFPRWPEGEVPIDSITNGVHVPTWDSAEADALWTGACGDDRWRGTMTGTPEGLACVSDDDLWAFRARSRASLVAFVRERLVAQLASAGLDGNVLEAASRVFDPDALTIGFARRFTAYKRPGLLLRDAERLARLVLDVDRPVQIVVAGKAHPRDEEGKEVVARWARFARRPDVRRRVVFLADYDLRLAERLVQGVDLWINTPLPPWEACGTSGMKVLVNGGLNLSTLDGWWAEAYRPEVGWAIPTEGDDGRDAVALYSLLENDVVPAFYRRDERGLPRAWVAKIRASMVGLTAHFSANRTIREYSDRFYLPALEGVASRTANGAEAARGLVARERRLATAGATVRFDDLRVRTENGIHRISVALYVGDLLLDDLGVELYWEHEGTPHVAPMRREAELVGARGFVWVADVPADRPAGHYTPRAVPSRATARVPLEAGFVAWAR